MDALAILAKEYVELLQEERNVIGEQPGTSDDSWIALLKSHRDQVAAFSAVIFGIDAIRVESER